MATDTSVAMAMHAFAIGEVSFSYALLIVSVEERWKRE
jgi:hypothetical protein